MPVCKRLRAMWADGFISTLRRMCGSTPRDRPSVQLERSVSLGSQLASYRVRNVEQRREAYRTSLLGACLASLCSDIARLSDNLPRLPPDLQQAVLDALISCGQLTDETVRLFRGLSVFELGLGKPPYPGVTDAWLPVFSSAHLVAVDVSGCSAVRPRSSMHDGQLPTLPAGTLAEQHCASRPVCRACTYADQTARNMLSRPVTRPASGERKAIRCSSRVL